MVFKGCQEFLKIVQLVPEKRKVPGYISDVR